MIKKALFLSLSVFALAPVGAMATETAPASAAPMMDKMPHDPVTQGQKAKYKERWEKMTPEEKTAWQEKKAARKAKHKERWEHMTPEEKDAHMKAREEHKKHWEKMSPAEKSARRKAHGLDHHYDHSNKTDGGLSAQ